MVKAPRRFHVPLPAGEASAADLRLAGGMPARFWSTFKGFKTMAKRRALRNMLRNWHAAGCDTRPGFIV